MSALSDWRGQKPPSANGNSEKVRDAIRRVGQPLSVDRLQMETGLSAAQVRSALGCMLSVSGGIHSIKGPKGRLYDLFENRPKPKCLKPSRGKPAGPIIYPQYRYGSTRLSW